LWTPSRKRPSNRSASTSPMKSWKSASSPLCGVADIRSRFRVRAPSSFLTCGAEFLSLATYYQENLKFVRPGQLYQVSESLTPAADSRIGIYLIMGWPAPAEGLGRRSRSSSRAYGCCGAIRVLGIDEVGGRMKHEHGNCRTRLFKVLQKCTRPPGRVTPSWAVLLSKLVRTLD
jgi:hypothetical protein